MDYLPLFFNVKNKPCLVIGGGDVACRKANWLIRVGAKLIIVAPEITQELSILVQENNAIYRKSDYQSADLKDCVLVIAATNDQVVNQQISQDAKKYNIPVNVVDNPELCTVIFPAIVDRSPLTIAISSGGHAPVLARQLRARLESDIPHSYGQLASFVGKFRQQVKIAIPDLDQRRHFWEEVLEGAIAENIFSGQSAKAEALFQQAIETTTSSNIGEAYLVGAGPGDPDLLTFRALRLMQKADVVLYDRLVSAEILDMVRRDAEKIYVGKRPRCHTVPQEAINHMIVRLAKEGKRVLRLKGGDPFIFGRGGEEITTLAEEGISFQVVPGITAASGCACYAGIPLTHRDYSQSVRFVTGHLQDGSCDLNWSELVQPNQTVVFYMGLTGLEMICNELMNHGMSSQTPIALIQQGTTSEQKIVVGDLSNLPARVKAADIKAPTLIIVGEVVKLHNTLAWFNPN